MTSSSKPAADESLDDIPDALDRRAKVTTTTPAAAKPKEVTEESVPATVTSIKKPSGSSLEKFKSKRAASVAGLDTLMDGLPIHKLSDAKDFVRLHPDEENYWSPELCFVLVPIKGTKKDTIHLIDEDLAMDFLPSGRIQRFRLALATKPYDVFFLAQIPSQNLDNSWNATSLAAAAQAMKLWTQVTSRKEEGIEAYKVDSARNPEAFPEPKWPGQSLDDLIVKTFAGRMITTEDHPALLRLIGDKQRLS
jgi:hypothetical protein